jgi:hypothetical protein
MSPLPPDNPGAGFPPPLGLSPKPGFGQYPSTAPRSPDGLARSVWSPVWDSKQ